MSNIASSHSCRPKASLEQLRRHTPEALITFRISVLSQMLSRLVDASVSQDLGLSSRQWRILVVLNRQGSMTSGEVARVASYDHSQVSRTAFELVSKGLIAQTDDAADRRRQVLSVTPTGIDVLRAGLVGSLERQERLRASLTREEYEILCRAITVLTEEARTMVAERKSERPAQ